MEESDGTSTVGPDYKCVSSAWVLWDICGAARVSSLTGPTGWLVGRAGLGEIGHDTEADPPDCEGGQAAERLSGEGDTVVGADALRQTVLAEEALETALGVSIGAVGGPAGPGRRTRRRAVTSPRFGKRLIPASA